jgi:Mn-dependent DtxR family transcriptional regulator/Fe2+ transport system protein FeoA
MNSLTTTSTEDCLEIIAKLAEKEGHAHVSDIARQLGVKKPSVTATLKTLAEKGLVQYKSYHPVELTRKGSQIASQVMKKHETLKCFLTQCLNLPAEHADSLACKLEHQLDDLAFERLSAFVKIKSLAALLPGEEAVIISLSPALGRRVAAYGLVKGASVRLSKIAPMGDPRSFLVNDTELSLRASEAKQIQVELRSPL